MNPKEIAESNLPGAEMVGKGLCDLASGTLSEEALLVLVASPRLRALAIEVPDSPTVPLPYEHALYSLLEEVNGEGAYSRYNSLIRRIVSFSRALEREVSARTRDSGKPA